ncbi:MAG: tryptophan 7-halogenase [Armatimonadetes bacterium]|nr:tryptophan 7-halogenase [Armatimonadota bacterium]
MAISCDVAIIGGGPAASTLGTLLRKYDPNLSIALFEREVFPRDHIGESQLPHLMPVLDEMGVWDKVEAADFPVKIGGLYRWGSSKDLWALDFLKVDSFQDIPRPAQYTGQRAQTAFQVDRSKYDKILLDHAREAGCQVYEGVRVVNILHEGDRINGLELVEGSDDRRTPLNGESLVQAKWYVDASGNSGLLRRKMGVEIDAPTELRNIAAWDYWQNTEWATRIGIGGTQILVLSLDWGWIWFIPLGPTRTSIGLVMPAEYQKKSGKTPEELYMEALTSEPTVSKLVANASREGKFETTKDWSFVSERLYGENWFLAGDAAGFADPILSAGLTLAQTGARNLAYTILEIERGELDADWLKQSYSDVQSRRIRDHIRFADYWYSMNGHFTELKEYCAVIADSAGIQLRPEDAFVWMGSGGFAGDSLGVPGTGTFTISAVKYNIRSMTGSYPKWEVEKYNSFRLNTEGAEKIILATYQEGRVYKIPCLKRGSLVLPDMLSYGAMYAALQVESDPELLLERYAFEAVKRGLRLDPEGMVRRGIEVLEAMLGEGWVVGEVKPEGRFLGMASTYPEQFVHMGWIQQGVGLQSIDPRQGGRVILNWNEYRKLQSPDYQLA